MSTAEPNLAPHAHLFPPLPQARAARFAEFTPGSADYFPGVTGIKLEEVRTDYARMRLPFRPQLNQPAGVMHGGAIATLIDTVVVPAIGGGYDEPHRYSTIDMQIQYLAPIIGEDAVAEGWITKRGRSIVFCRAQVLTGSGTLAALGTLVYNVRPWKSA
ncbi:MAG TPA: PaaI family thioesterase [Candidatus Limnocylindrales bacterium]|nr:PaaI family thioesterase [Candidatus Limnocylindrales bacterium]